MKVLLIAAGEQENFISRAYPALGLSYLRGYVEKYADFEVSFTLIHTGEFPPVDAANPPDLIGISAVTEYFTCAQSIAQKARGIVGDTVPIILGGCHISALPLTLPPVFDAAVLGEGEETFLDILRKLNNRGQLLPEDFAGIPGLAYFPAGSKNDRTPDENHSENHLMFSQPRPFIRELDTIPYPIRSRSPLGLTHMITSRGCPYSCIYCATIALWGPTRSHSAEYVVAEMEHVQKTGAHNIIIFDDNFCADRERVKAISRLMQEKGLSNNLEFTCYGRTRAMTGNLVEDLGAMGVTEIYLGADSVRDYSLEEARDSKSYEKNGAAIRMCHQAGMKVNCSFVIGLPHQSVEDLDRIHQFIEEYSDMLSAIQVSPLNLFPATPLWDYAREKGLIPENIQDWSLFGRFTTIYDFSPDSYIFLNRKMTPDEFTNYCRSFEQLTRRINFAQGGR